MGLAVVGTGDAQGGGGGDKDIDADNPLIVNKPDNDSDSESKASSPGPRCGIFASTTRILTRKSRILMTALSDRNSHQNFYRNFHLMLIGFCVKLIGSLESEEMIK